MARVIFHIDLNAFFCSAEELRHPELKGKPMAVGSLKNRGVIATANYAARELGIHSAMPTRTALNMAPELVVLPNDPAYYRKLSQQFFSYLKQFSTALEVKSIDECYLDVTDAIRKYKRPMDLAVQIQLGVKQKLGLSCSIGVAPTKFLAKVASDLRKPMGITIIRKSEIKNKLWPLPIEKMLGVGKKTRKLLEEKGIETIGDLADPENRPVLEPLLKSSYSKMMDQVYGRSEDKLSFSTTQKTMSHSTTFQQDLYSVEEMREPLARLCHELFEKSRQKGIYGKTLAILLRDTEFNSRMHSLTLTTPLDSYEKLYSTALTLLEEKFEPIGYRLLGIHIGSFGGEKIIQPTLLEPQNDPTEDILNRFNNEMEGIVLKRASDLLNESK